MKKIFFVWAVALLLCVPAARAGELKLDMPAADWSFPDADGNMYTMASWAGKVLVVNYVDPDESDLNEHFTEALKKAREEGRLQRRNL